jgi:hypothetical protein
MLCVVGVSHTEEEAKAEAEEVQVNKKFIFSFVTKILGSLWIRNI